VILHDPESDEYLRVNISPGKLANVFPVVSVKEQSKELLTISYYHLGVRSSLFVSDVAFKKVRPRATMRSRPSAAPH
jgi:hypothetical protein